MKNNKNNGKDQTIGNGKEQDSLHEIKRPQKVLQIKTPIKVILVIVAVAFLVIVNFKRGDTLILNKIVIHDNVQANVQMIEDPVVQRFTHLIDYYNDTNYDFVSSTALRPSPLYKLWKNNIKIGKEGDEGVRESYAFFDKVVRSLLKKGDHYVNIIIKPTPKDTTWVEVSLSECDWDGAPVNSKIKVSPIIVENNEEDIIKACSRVLCEQYLPLAAVLSDYSLMEDTVDYQNSITWDKNNLQRDISIIDGFLSKSVCSTDSLFAEYFLAEIYWQLARLDRDYYIKALEVYDMIKKKEKYSPQVIKNEDKIREIKAEMNQNRNTIAEGLLKKNMGKLKNSKQLIIAYGENSSKRFGRMNTFEFVNGEWREVNVANNIRVNFGLNGIAKHGEKKEGDMKVPSGLYPITRYFTKDSNSNAKLNRINIGINTVWDCNPQSTTYNTPIEYLGEKNPLYEPLYTRDKIYDYVIVIDYNMHRTPMKGSAIFLHCSRKSNSATAGCLSIAEENMLSLFRWLNIDDNPMILIETLDNK